MGAPDFLKMAIEAEAVTTLPTSASAPVGPSFELI